MCSPVSSTNKTDYHDIIEILLKVAINTITLTLTTTHAFVVDISVSCTFELKRLCAHVLFGPLFLFGNWKSISKGDG